MNENEILTPEQLKEERRKKQLAILKASNEMLEEAKQKVLKTDKLSDVEKSEKVGDITESQKENIMKAKTYLNARLDEIANAEYNTVKPGEVEKYKKRLENKGLTDEQLHQKESATVTVAKGKGGSSKRTTRKRIRGNEEESSMEIIRVENEEELMKQSMMKSPYDFNPKYNKGEEKDLNEIVTKMMKSKKVVVEESTREASKENKAKRTTTTAKISEAKIDKKDEKTDNAIENKETKSDFKDEYNFDFSSIPSYVQYDMIPLPSKGECYPHKLSRIPVAYLTASDENIIASPNMYRDGKIIDVILKRKILDKTVDVDKLTKGDRDAIALWLRATGYGIDFPVVVTNPNNGNRYDIVVKLDTFDYKPFNLKGDENGYFEYELANGDKLKFRFLTNNDEESLRERLIEQNTNIGVFNIMKNANMIETSLKETNLINEDLKSELMGCVDDIREIVKDVDVTEKDDNEMYSSSITEQMILYTMSVNGNEDKDFIRGYIENMKAKDAYDYRTYVLSNRPGVDFSMTVDIPQSDGGGSFDTFLRVDNTIFINI